MVGTTDYTICCRQAPAKEVFYGRYAEELGNSVPAVRVPCPGGQYAGIFFGHLNAISVKERRRIREGGR